MMKCAIIDDEPLAREGLENYISEVDFLALVGTAASPLDYPAFEKEGKIDLLFLDIQMPVMSGIDFLKVQKERPMVIMTTAFPNHALESFELDVLDYLLKPITFHRFYKAVTKAFEYHRLRNATQNVQTEADEYFFVKSNQAYEKIFFKDVLHVESNENYVVIHTLLGTHMVLMPMKRIEELLGEGFLRVHKSYIVAINKIDSIDRDGLVVNGLDIPIGKTNRELILERIMGNKLFKK